MGGYCSLLWKQLSETALKTETVACASMCLSNSGIIKPKKEAVIVKSNGGEKLSYLILILYASFGPLKTS